VIDRIRDPSSTTTNQFKPNPVYMESLQETNSDVRRRIDETNEPRISTAFGCTIAIEWIIRDTHLDGKGEIGAIGTSLIPSLDTGSD